MNKEHYEKVKRVLDRSDEIMSTLSSTLSTNEAINASNQLCAKVWEEIFPDHSTYNKRIKFDLSHADFSNKLFSSVADVILCSANFSHAILENTRWSGMFLSSANFTGANMKNCMMVAVSLHGTSFKDADLTNAYLAPTLGFGAVDPIDFSGAKMDGLKLVLHDKLLKEDTSYEESKQAVINSIPAEQREQITIIGNTTNSSSCFIATASCGAMSEEVSILREFRDNTLLTNLPGRKFVDTYMSYSPPVARTIEKSAIIKWFVRMLLIKPTASLIKRFTHKSQ